MDSQFACHISHAALYLRAIHRRGVEGAIDGEWGEEVICMKRLVAARSLSEKSKLTSPTARNSLE